jgi:hypothetical protein
MRKSGRPDLRGREGDSGERICITSYFPFEKNPFSFGPLSGLWRMTPSQPA